MNICAFSEINSIFLLHFYKFSFDILVTTSKIQFWPKIICLKFLSFPRIYIKTARNKYTLLFLLTLLFGLYREIRRLSFSIHICTIHVYTCKKKKKRKNWHFREFSDSCKRRIYNKNSGENVIWGEYVENYK